MYEIGLAKDSTQLWALVNAVMILQVLYTMTNMMSNYQLLIIYNTPWSYKLKTF
jgi:hypothetical protein